MNGTPLQAIAAEYAAYELSILPAFHRSKVPMVSITPYQYEPPTAPERIAMFSFDSSKHSLNIGMVCGAASNNSAVIDAESKRAFETQLRRCEQAGVSDRWIVETWRGGHIHLNLPVAVKPKSFKGDEFEVRAQGQFVLLPPSVHPSGTQYTFVNRPPTLINIPSLAQLDWLRLEPAPEKNLPLKAKYLLAGKGHKQYGTRSEFEQAIISVLFNGGFCFDEVLAIFRTYPAAGKFREMDASDPKVAEAWLLRSFDRARNWCASDSPARRRVRAIQAQAEGMPWPGRTGSADKSVFLAHLNFAHRSGGDVYHAGCRDIAEIAGCGQRTARKASKRLRMVGLIKLVTPASFPYANRYQLTENTKMDPLPHISSYGMGSTSSFLLPEAFRKGGLGRSAFEVLKALEIEPLRAKELSSKTGRHVQTIRKSLHKLRGFGYAKKSRGKWYGTPVERIDLVELAKKVGMSGARKRQREQHKADRLRRTITMKLRQGGAEIDPRHAGHPRSL